MQANDGVDPDFEEEPWEDEDEDMPATERDLADDAQWKLIQKNTFTRWANEHLKTINKNIGDLESDFSDGLRLLGLIEVLSGNKFKHANKRPNFRTQKLENVTMALSYLERDEGIKIVNIDSSDIVDKKLKLILGLIWTLILHYSISMPMWEGEEPGPQEGGPTPKQRLLNWIQSKIPDLPIKNFTTDWNDGKAIGALVDAVGPGLCPDWQDWDPKNKEKNAKEAMDAAQKWLDVPQLIKPKELTNPKVDEMSMMTYLSQFPNAKLKPGAPLRPRLNTNRVRAFGPGLEPKGNQVGAPARFTVETFSAGKGEIEVKVLNPKGKTESCEVVFNNDRNLTYSCVYVPSMEGEYRVIIKFGGKEIPKSPFVVKVEGATADPSKVTAEGPGLEKTGLVATKRTYFHVYTKGKPETSKGAPGKGAPSPGKGAPSPGKGAPSPGKGAAAPGKGVPGKGAPGKGAAAPGTATAVPAPEGGKGKVDVTILDPHGRKDSVRPAVTALPDQEGAYLVEYVPREPGLHSINVFFSGHQIPHSPFGVNVSPASNAKMCFASGRGIQPRGIRVRDNADFKVHTKGAGVAEVKVQIFGPGGIEVSCTVKKSTTEEGVFDCVYIPLQKGQYIINVTFGDQHITKSPFKVDVGPQKDSKIIAYGPGLESGVVNQPAMFTVETRGETGALGFSIEGPSEAKIDCKDNEDGSADVTYWPTAPGEYAVHIICNEEDIPKSPYMAEIKPATTEFDASKVIATGPGLEKSGVQTGAWAEFTVDARKAGKAPLKISCLDINLKSIDVQIKDNKDGTFSCKYKPFAPVKHTIMITYGSVMIPKSPFRVNVQEPSKPGNVKVYGPGVEKGVKTMKKTHFKVDCKTAGPGDVAIALTDEQGRDVPVNVIDNQDGTFTIEYEPKTPGTYTVAVYFGGQEIPKSPIKVKIESSIDVSKVKVIGMESPIKVGEQRDIEIVTTAAGKADTPARVLITPPSGKQREIPTEGTIDGYGAKFALLEPGPHKVDVSYAGMAVPKSPFTLEAIPAAAGVKAYGPGLQGGVANKPAEFTIDTREASQPGGLGVTVEGPSEAKIECRDNQNGTCDVTYFPTVPGDYSINVLYADQHIEKSPFHAKVEPGPVLDVSNIRAYGPGLEPQGVFLDSLTEFTVDAKSVTPTSEGKVRAVLTSPASATKTDSFIKPNDDGTYQVLYTPFEEGPQIMDVTYEGVPIPHSPFTINAVPGCDASRVKAYGPGLESGITDQSQEFTVDVKGAGPGGLALGIDGPAETKINCKDNRDGTCTVDYKPTVPGDYNITVKFADQEITGSPFHVPVKKPVCPEKVKCYGPGLDSKGVRQGAPATFTVDTTEAGEAPLEVTYTNEKGVKQPADLVPVADGKIEATYFPVEEGKCQVEVKYANQQVPNSPFPMEVLPSHDASKVRMTGDGISNSIPASMPATFTIDTREAGLADLEVAVKRPDGTLAQPDIKNNGDATFNVSYTPEDVGNYNIGVKFGGDNAGDAPYTVNTYPVGDASKCVITEGLEKTVLIKKETVITVDASQAGTGKVTCRIHAPDGTDIDIELRDNADGTFAILFTPQYPGNYSISIKFGGESIPNGEYTIEVGEDLISPQRAGGVHSAPPGSGLYQPVDFKIPVGPFFSFVTAQVRMPSGNMGYPKIDDNKDGTVTVRYQPTETGLHELHVQYNNEPVQGSPYLFHVDAVNSGFVTAYGPGLSHGVCNCPAEFTIVTKDAGAGGLSLAIEGPSKTEIKCTDNENGTCTVSYIPTAPGEYTIVVKFADKNISGSPFTAKITPGEPRKRAQIGRSSEVSLKVTETDISSLTASIRTPSGKEEPCILKRLPNGHLGISFTPHEVGEHLVNVFRNGKHIANSPFKIVVGESELGNASKVKVYGKGLEEGMANEVNEFIVDTTEAGYGGLSLSIEGPSKADIECHDNDDGTCRVTYKPTEPGNYIINIKFADEHVPGSSFAVKIGGEPSSRITERITRHAEAVDMTHIGSECELSLKIPASYFEKLSGSGAKEYTAPGTSPFDMTASVTSPSNVTELCEIVSLDDSHYSIKFVPKEMGVHTVSVKHKDMHIPGSPFEFTVGPITGGGPHKVHAAGPGLERGEIKQPCEFNIYTREAGAGGLSIAVEGPSKADITFEDRKDGSCGVSYVVTEPGEYLVSIKFADEHIPDSPFRVMITPSIGDARKLSISALQSKGLQVGKPAAFVVNFNGAKGKLKARVISPSMMEDEAIIQELDEGEYAVRFIPRENGPHFVHVTFEDCEIPDSPFRVLVGKVDSDPGMVHAYGDGLKHGNTGEVCKFMVNTVNAGAGALAVTIEGPSKVKLECHEVEEGYEFTYRPTAPGDYLIVIRYSGVHIAGSPFKAKIEGPGQATGVQEHASVIVETVTKTSIMSRFSGLQKFQSDASKVVCEGNGLKKAYRGKQSTFTVDTSNAGNNILYVGMMGPKGPCEELIVKHTGGNQYKITYIVKERGDYMLMVRWGDENIPGSPFCVKAD